MNHQKLSPVTGAKRILSLDVLRGFALLGILLINIQSFAMPGSAYLNPMSYGDMSGINGWVWKISYILGDSKMMAIFSTLFGAGIILVTQKAEKHTGKSAGLHYKRTFWLLIFGLIHAHLIWAGDILVAYAVCGALVYFLRNKSVRTLIVTGFVLIAVHTVLYSLFGMSVSSWPEESMVEAMKSWMPGAAQHKEEIAAITGTLSEQIAYNSNAAVFMETFVFLFIFLWRASGLMLIGMALYKMGVLSAQRSPAFYKKGWLIGWLIGFPLVIAGVYKNYAADWSYEYSMFFGPQLNYWGSLGVSFGYICAIMLFMQSPGGLWIKERLAAVGQMAFTNYIAQSLIGVFIFWGVGLELFGQVDRLGQLLFVIGIWIIQILWSKPWLTHFRFGPLEWLWRSLTYGSLQPFKREHPID